MTSKKDLTIKPLSVCIICRCPSCKASMSILLHRNVVMTWFKDLKVEHLEASP